MNEERMRRRRRVASDEKENSGGGADGVAVKKKATKARSIVIPKGTQWKMLLEVNMSEPQPPVISLSSSDEEGGGGAKEKRDERYNFIFSMSMKAAARAPPHIAGTKGSKPGLWLTSTDSLSVRCVETGKAVPSEEGPEWSSCNTELRLFTANRGAPQLVSCFSEKGKVRMPRATMGDHVVTMKNDVVVQGEFECVILFHNRRISEVALRISRHSLQVNSEGIVSVDFKKGVKSHSSPQDSASDSSSAPKSRSGMKGGQVRDSAAERSIDKRAKLEERMASPSANTSRPQRARRQLARASAATERGAVAAEDEADPEADTDEAVSGAEEEEEKERNSDDVFESMDSDEDSEATDVGTLSDSCLRDAPEAVDLLAGLEDFVEAEVATRKGRRDKETAFVMDSDSDEEMAEFESGNRRGKDERKRLRDSSQETLRTVATAPAKKIRKMVIDSDDEIDKLLADSDSQSLEPMEDIKPKRRVAAKKNESNAPLKQIVIDSDDELEAFLESDFKVATKKILSEDEETEEQEEDEERVDVKPKRRLRKGTKKKSVRRSLDFDSDEESDLEDFSLPGKGKGKRKRRSYDDDDDDDDDDTLAGFIVDGSEEEEEEEEDERPGKGRRKRLPDLGPEDIIDSLLTSSEDEAYDTDELLDSAMGGRRPSKDKRKILTSAPLASPKKALEKRREQQQQQQQLEDDQLYSNYILSIPLHCAHPAHIVESTTLASARPPPLTYEADLPSCCLDRGDKSTLSSLQLETVRYVGQRHEQTLADNSRAGYFCGDGTGVGKGREIAAIIADNFLKGRKKSVWVTASTSLLRDAQRDLRDIGCGPNSKNHIRIFPIPDKVASSITQSTGTLLVTYSMLVAGGRPRYRYEQILEWLTDGSSSSAKPYYPWQKEKGKGKEKKGEESEEPQNERYAFDGPILFDESHRSKNLNVKDASKSSKTAQLVSLLQEQLPSARIVYVSATGASEPAHLGYMPRLGLWGPSTSFPSFEAFFKKVDKSGIGAMEMVAMEMKSLGMYCSRHLSFSGTEFDIVQLPLAAKQRTLYDMCTAWWNVVIRDYTYYYEHGYLPKDGDKSSKKIAMRLLWAAHQRFFLLLLVSLKQAKCTEIALQARKDGYAVVIGLFSTGEKSQEEALSKHFDFDSLLSSPELMLTQFIEKWYPYNQLTQNGLRAHPEALMKKTDLIRQVKALHLPENPLDKLIDTLGGASKVAEMTGRTKRLVRKKGGTFRPGSRVPSRDNNDECQAFMQGEKNLAVISEAASIGISLQASNTVPNRKRRMHIILQLPWSAEKAVQQLGRTHRSHQASAPLYKLLVTECGGEWRLAATIAGRLAALGALTSGDRRAGAGAATLSQFTIIPRYGMRALLSTEAFVKSQGVLQDDDGADSLSSDKNLDERMTALLSGAGSLDEPLCIDSDEEGGPAASSAQGGIVARDDLDTPMAGKEWAELYGTMTALGVFSSKNSGDKVKRFLNRLLGLSIRFQAHLFDRFIHQYDQAVDQAQQEGTYEDGVYDIEGKYADPLSETTLVYEDPRNYQQKTYRLDLHVSRGIGWEDAQKLLEQAQVVRSQREDGLAVSKAYFPPNGFYQHKRSFTIILAMQRDNRNYYHVVKPHIGHQGSPVTRNDLRRQYEAMTLEDAYRVWSQKFLSNAESEGTGGGLLKRTILVGSILPTFDILADELQVTHYNNEGKAVVRSQLQVVRAHCPDPTDEKKRKKYVGILLPKNKVDTTLARLKERQDAGVLELRRYDLARTLAHDQIPIYPLKLEELPLAKLQAYLGGEENGASIVEVVEEVKAFVRKRASVRAALEARLQERFGLSLDQASYTNKREIDLFLLDQREMPIERLMECIEERVRRDTSVLNVLFSVMSKQDLVMNMAVVETEAQRATGLAFSRMAGTIFHNFVHKYPTWLKKTGATLVFKGSKYRLEERNKRFPAISDSGATILQKIDAERERLQRQQHSQQPQQGQPGLHLPSHHPLATPPVTQNAWTDYTQQQMHLAKQRQQQIMQQQQEARSQAMRQRMQASGLAPGGSASAATFGATSHLSALGNERRVTSVAPSVAPSRSIGVGRPSGWKLDSTPPPPLPQFSPRPKPAIIILSDSDDD